MSEFLKNLPFKRWFVAHPSLLGSLFGLLIGFLLSTLTVPSAMFLVAPLLAGFLAGFFGGSGSKAGILTLVLPILVILTIPLAFPTVDWAASTMPEVEGVGAINATMAALTNGLIRSTWGIAHGLAAISSAISGIITLIILIMIPILIAFGLGITGILGFIGGKIGTVMRTRYSSRVLATPPSQTQTSLQPAPSLSTIICPSCGYMKNTIEGQFCSNCGAPFVKSTSYLSE